MVERREKISANDMFYDYDPGKHKFYHFSEVNLLGRFICTRCVTAEHLPFIYTVVCIGSRRMYTPEPNRLMLDIANKFPCQNNTMVIQFLCISPYFPQRTAKRQSWFV